MSEATAGVSRGKFLHNAAKGGLVLVGSGGVLAAAEGVAFASGPTTSDVKTLQAAYVAESLAVVVYSAIIANFSKFTHPKLQNKDYFVAALKNEKDHKAFLKSALGSKTPAEPTFKIPASVTKTGQSLLDTGVALETAFVEAYLGAVETLSSTDLKVIARRSRRTRRRLQLLRRRCRCRQGQLRRPRRAAVAAEHRDDSRDDQEAAAVPRLIRNTRRG